MGAAGKSKIMSAEGKAARLPAGTGIDPSRRRALKDRPRDCAGRNPVSWCGAGCCSRARPRRGPQPAASYPPQLRAEARGRQPRNTAAQSTPRPSLRCFKTLKSCAPSRPLRLRRRLCLVSGPRRRGPRQTQCEAAAGGLRLTECDPVTRREASRSRPTPDPSSAAVRGPPCLCRVSRVAG